MEFTVPTYRTVIPFTLAFAGGYGDAAGYLLAKCFTGHITGNTVLLAAPLFSDSLIDSRIRLWLFLCLSEQQPLQSA